MNTDFNLQEFMSQTDITHDDLLASVMDSTFGAQSCQILGQQEKSPTTQQSLQPLSTNEIVLKNILAELKTMNSQQETIMKSILTELNTFNESFKDFLANSTDAKSFESLIDYMKRISPHSSISQLLLARGLMAWIGHAQTILDVNAPYNSPMNLVAEMVNRRVSHAQVFKTFCGYANIDCKVVNGRAKAIRYRAGDGDSYYLKGHSWNIFTADGHQHLIHPGWAVHAILGYSHGGELVVEADGQTQLFIKQGHGGHSTYVFNNFWFCTHPKIFVTRCFPDTPQDQLLPAADMIQNVNEFLALPDLRQAFFQSDLSLMTERSCRLNSNKGKCQINLLTNSCKPKNLNFSYELSIINSGSPMLRVDDLPRLVLFTRNQDVYEFEIRFPVIGTYRFLLKLHFEGRNNNCCEFIINCTEIDTDCKKIPFDNGIEGYGFGPSAEEAGLKNPSESGGKVYIEPSASKGRKECKNKELKYKIDEDCVTKNNYASEIFSVDRKGKTVAHPGKSRTVVDPATCSMCIELHVDEPGEYALVINAGEKGKGKKSEVRVAKYILSTDKEVRDNQLQIKLQKRQVKKENKTASKEIEKRTKQEEYDSLQTEIDELELYVSGGKQ